MMMMMARMMIIRMMMTLQHQTPYLHTFLHGHLRACPKSHHMAPWEGVRETAADSGGGFAMEKGVTYVSVARMSKDGEERQARAEVPSLAVGV